MTQIRIPVEAYPAKMVQILRDGCTKQLEWKTKTKAGSRDRQLEIKKWQKLAHALNTLRKELIKADADNKTLYACQVVLELDKEPPRMLVRPRFGEVDDLLEGMKVTEVATEGLDESAFDED